MDLSPLESFVNTVFKAGVYGAVISLAVLVYLLVVLIIETVKYRTAEPGAPRREKYGLVRTSRLWVLVTMAVLTLWLLVIGVSLNTLAAEYIESVQLVPTDYIKQTAAMVFTPWVLFTISLVSTIAFAATRPWRLSIETMYHLKDQYDSLLDKYNGLDRENRKLKGEEASDEEGSREPESA